MPNRIIKESICTSEKVAALTDFEFRLWIGLILSVDDAGRGDARAAVLRGRIFPLRERVSVKDVESALHGLAAKGCISLYTVGGKSYFWFPTWTKHQRIRDCKPKYPGPEESDCPSAAACGELRHPAATCGGLPQPAAIIQSESNPESESESQSKSRSPSPERKVSASGQGDEDAVRERGFCPELEEAVLSWLRYKRERREGYKPTGLAKLLTQIEREARDYGAAAVVDVMGKSMSANYQGIIWDWLRRPGAGAAGAGNQFLDMLKQGVFDDDKS